MKKFHEPINKNPIGSNQRYFSALRGLLLCIGIPDPWTRMLITPDSSYFGGIQSWTYQDFDFLFPWSKTRDAKDANLFPAQAHGQKGHGPSVNTEKGSEKVSKHCTAS